MLVLSSTSSVVAMQQNHQRRTLISDQSDDDLDPQASFAQPVLDLITTLKSCIGIIGRNVEYQRTQYSKKDEHVKEL